MIVEQQHHQQLSLDEFCTYISCADALVLLFGTSPVALIEIAVMLAVPVIDAVGAIDDTATPDAGAVVIALVIVLVGALVSGAAVSTVAGVGEGVGAAAVGHIDAGALHSDVAAQMPAPFSEHQTQPNGAATVLHVLQSPTVTQRLLLLVVVAAVAGALVGCPNIGHDWLPLTATVVQSGQFAVGDGTHANTISSADKLAWQ
jgi:hypothetical protein